MAIRQQQHTVVEKTLDKDGCKGVVTLWRKNSVVPHSAKRELISDRVHIGVKSATRGSSSAIMIEFYVECKTEQGFVMTPPEVIVKVPARTAVDLLHRILDALAADIPE